MRSHPTPRCARRRVRLAATVAVATVLASGAALAAPAATASSTAPSATSTPLAATPAPPTLTPADGAFLEGTTKVASSPVAAGDSVTSLTLDGTSLDATATTGVSHLSYDVGSNSMDAAFGNYLLVNGHRIDPPRTAVSERVDLEIPNDYLVTGENTIEIHAGGVESSCGVNFDDFAISDISLDLLGETADGEENEYTYQMGDGTCGSNTSYVKTATLTFHVLGDPRGTTGLTTELDTTTVANGTHSLVATTAAGKATTHTVRVNNAPAGAPYISPVDGTLVKGRQPVIAAQPADSEGGVASLRVDGEEPPTSATLGGGTSTFSFDVGSNSIELRYQNHLLVNGHQVDLGGDHASRRVDVAVPNRYLVPGDNTITLVSGDITSACGVNRDDFTVSNLAFTPSTGTAVPQDLADSYAMGDGNCGSATGLLTEVELHWTIDAPAVHETATLGTGNAVLSFDVGANSMDGAVDNYLVVNGIEQHHLPTLVGERGNLEIPNAWLVPGHNVIELVTGAFVGTCANYDDFTISNVALTPATGNAKNLSIAASYAMGDGVCGTNVTLLKRVDLHFDIDAPARGRRADVRTAQLADGEHEIAATSTTGEKATRLLVTDNSAPTVASSTPAAGERITTAATLALEVGDPSGVVGATEITLDGKTVEVGAPVGPGLSAGEHTIAVTATDSLGNAGTREVVFSSAGIPDAPVDLSPAQGASDVDGTATLSAKVSEPDGGDVTATFTQSEVLTPQQGWQGTASDVPTTLAVRGERGIRDLKAVAPGDDASAAAPKAQDVTFQRFDIAVKSPVDDPVLRWEGTVDPERLASLRVWNVKTAQWDVVAASRGAAEGSTVLSATVDRSYVDKRKVHVLVTGEDPFADDIEAGDPDAFADPDTYDFSIVHYTDTQYLSEGAVEQETAAERAAWAAGYTKVMDWITSNAASRKIAYVAHTGDVTENNISAPTTDAMRQQVTGEYTFTSQAQGILDAAGIANGVIAGNHDNQSGTETGPSSIFNQYYGPDRYGTASTAWQHASYGGPWREGDNQNHYDLFSAGGLDFVVVGLSYGVTKEEADWADSIFKKYPDRNGILLSHDYLAPSTNPDGRGAKFSAPDGSMLYKTVVQDNPNVFLILAGHEHGVGTNVKAKVGEISHDVVELLADYQFYTVDADRLGLTEIGGYKPTDRLQFGASYFRMLQFDVDRSELVVDTYSPLLDDFGATEFDTNRRYDGREDNMVLPVDLSSRSTTFSTDSLALYVPTDVIATTTVASGDVAEVTWKGLDADTVYTWFVTARSAGGGTSTSEPSVFVTKDAKGGPGSFGPRHPLWPYYPKHSPGRPTP